MLISDLKKYFKKLHQKKYTQKPFLGRDFRPEISKKILDFFHTHIDLFQEKIFFALRRDFLIFDMKIRYRHYKGLKHGRTY
jgi:hypothetical protein